MTIAELMIPELKAEAAMTRRLLERVPDDRFGFTPGHGLHTIGWNANHLASIAGWGVTMVQDDFLDLAPPGVTAEPTPEATTTAAVLATFDANLAKSLAALEGVPDSKMDEDWSLKHGGHTLLTMKKGPCLRKWLFTHQAHHRGILSAYLKMVGVKFSSIYEE